MRSTVLREFASCPRRAYYAYECGLRRKGRPDPHIFFGKAVHEALRILTEQSEQAAIQYLASLPWQDICHQTKNLAAAKALVALYARDGLKDVEVVACERLFSFSLGNHTWRGRFDKVIRLNGLLYVEEVKTCSSFQFQVKPNVQLASYYLGGKIFYPDIAGVVLTLLNAKRIAMERLFVSFNQEEIEEWRNDAKTLAEFYVRCRTRNVFPRNTAACTTHFAECEFLPLCSSVGVVRDAIMEKMYELDEERIQLDY